PAKGASLAHVSLRRERWGGGRQPGETLDQFSESRQERSESKEAGGSPAKRLTSLAKADKSEANQKRRAAARRNA
ncbi:MAG: hypothetical protein ABIP56_02630, partial [Dokdonella sp.]